MYLRLKYLGQTRSDPRIPFSLFTDSREKMHEFLGGYEVFVTGLNISKMGWNI